MQPQPGHDVTGLLHAWRPGDAGALDLLIPLLQKELHQIARHHRAAQRRGHTLQTTALLHEAYLRLVDAKRAEWHDRSHFLAACSQIMRRILVDHARARRAAKRGGGGRMYRWRRLGRSRLNRIRISSLWMKPSTLWPSTIHAKPKLWSCDSSEGQAWRRARPRSKYPRKACCATDGWREPGSHGN